METKKLHRSQFVAQTNWRIISFLALSSKCLLIEGAHNHHIRQPYVSSEERPTRGERLCTTLRWRHNGSDGVSNHQPHDCLLNHLCRRRSKKTSKLRVTGLCVGTGEFPAQMASSAENVSISWRHHVSRLHIWTEIIPSPLLCETNGCAISNQIKYFILHIGYI